MRVHLQSNSAGPADAGRWLDVGVLSLPHNGYHWMCRASVELDAATDARVELRGSSGTTVLWSGDVARVPVLVTLPVTLPGDKLALVVRIPKRARAHFEVSWIQNGPMPEDDPCAR